MMKTVFVLFTAIFLATASVASAGWQLEGTFIVKSGDGVSMQRLLSLYNTFKRCKKGAGTYIATNKAAIETLGGVHLEEGGTFRGGTKLVGVTTWRCTKF